MKATQLVSIVGASALFLATGCEDEASVPPGVTLTPDKVVPAEPPEPAAPDASAPARVPLEIEFPPFVEDGTPKPVNVPNCLPRPDHAPVFLVPEDARLLSRGKPVTSSDDFPIIGELSLITDGDCYAGEGYHVELMNGLQWVQVDLEARAEISVVWVWHDHSTKKAFHDVVVQVSDDADFKEGVTTLFNNDYDGSAPFGIGRDRPYVESRFGMPIDAKGVRGRYVRLYSSGSTYEEANRCIEVEVYGRTP